MRWLQRRWRSVSFRSGAGSALVVGVITALGLLILAVVIFGTFVFSSAALQATVMDRVSNQLLGGVTPAQLVVDGTATEFVLEDGFWAVVDGGDVVASGGDFSQALLDAPYESNSTLIDDGVEDFDISGTKRVDGEQWLIFEDAAEVDDETYTVVTGTSGNFVFRRFLRDGLSFFIPVLLVVMTVAGLITSWFTRRALGSVEKMRAEVEHISQESLDRRVPTTGSRDRIDKLAETMNEMLARLETSTAQQNQFLADASHELRSPVAGLVAQLDVAAAYPDKVDPQVLLPKLRSETQRLQMVLDDLLFLSRSEAEKGVTPPPPAHIDIDVLLANELAHQHVVRPSLEFSSSGATGTSVLGNERDLARAIRNVVDNAARHTETRVSLSTAQADGRVLITITDDGDGIDADDAERIFERFVRLDDSRARDAGGSGLGLAIVHQIVGAHGGSIRVLPPEGKGAVFEMSLPAAP